MTADYRSKQIAEQLAAVFPGARVLIVLREQESMLLSSYREYVVCGGETLEEFIGATVARPGFEPHCRLDHLEYDLALAHYRDLLRSEAVMVEPFERMVADLVEFYRRLAVFCGARGSYEQPAPARNVGLAGATLTARRVLNNLVHPSKAHAQRATNGSIRPHQQHQRGAQYRPAFLAGEDPCEACSRGRQRLGKDRILEEQGTSLPDEKGAKGALDECVP